MSRIPIRVELRFQPLPAHWTRRKERLSGEYVLVPELDYSPEAKCTPVADPMQLCNRFLKLKRDEASALEFLNEIGVWQAAEDPQAKSIFVGHRWFHDRPLPLTLEELWEEQEHWRELLRNQAKLRKAFRPPGESERPFDKLSFAVESRFGNTLPVHLEWKHNRPQAALQPVTGSELLQSLAWQQVVNESALQMCQHCGKYFPHPWKKMYCTPNCAHAAAVRRWRKKKALRKKGTRLIVPRRSGNRVTA